MSVYYARFGHFHVSIREDQSLCKFCQKVRRGKKQGELTDDQIASLDAIGFDDNGNAVVDAGENQIKDCESDNSYLFHSSGIGNFYDNAKACDIPGDHHFTWDLKGDSVLTISHQKMFVLRLNETEMILQPDLPWLTSKFLLSYKR